MTTMTTMPTCAACGTKFPGRDSCKSCGCDPVTGDAFRPYAPVVSVASKSADPRERRRRKAQQRSMMQAAHRRKHGR